MANQTAFLPFLVQTLGALEEGDYKSVDFSKFQCADETECQIVAMLERIQLRNIRLEEVLQRCVVGDYSSRLKALNVHDRTGHLVNKLLEKLNEVVRQANVISKGDYSAEILPQSDQDELGIALFKMTRTLREIAEVSLKIAAGDFSKQVEMKGDQDLLAQAINLMIGSLREMERQAKAIAGGDYSLDIGPRSAQDVLARSIDKMMRTIRSQLVALEQSNQGLSEFAHVASHDLSAPLCKIKYCCDLISEACQGKIRGNLYELFDVIIRSCNQMSQLIRDLLEHAQIGYAEKDCSDVDLNDLIDGIISDFSPEIERIGARISHEPLPRVQGDRTSLQRLFQNLIGNAIKYRGSAPLALVIAANGDEKHCTVSFKDNGIGIESSCHKKIFDPFVRLHTSSNIPGTGIGLATCNKIVMQLGGKIWLSSEPGKGSTFFVSLPRSESVTRAEAAVGGPSKKILLVDDDKDQLLILSAILEKGDYTITSLNSPAAGLEALRSQPFDLVISDVQMPNIDGAQFISEIRRHNNIPILMLTSSGPERCQELLTLGANGFCTKKDAFNHLLSKVRSLLKP